MNWLGFRKKTSVQSNNIASKFSSSTNGKSTADAESPTDTPVGIQHMAKILIIGETGSGKSTFINYLTNYFRDGTYDSPRIAIPTRYYTKITESFGHCEKAIDDVTISKTDACHQYLFHDSKTDKQYLFLDTPGLGDTRGAQQDQTNIETILNAINNLQGLTAVIIVVNGSVARITTNFKSVLLGLRGNLPDIVMDHVVVILSHVKRHQSTFDIKKTLKMNGTTVYPYYMQNSAFAQDPKKWGAHEHEHIESDWAESMQEIRLMLSIINNFQTKSVAAFDDMRTIRNAIKTCMHEARLEITNVQQMHDQILAYEQAVQKYQSDEISYQDYTQEQTVVVNELVDAPYHSTLCRQCNFVCHQKCSLEETQEIGNQILQHCAAMDSENNCKKCPHNCSHTNHYHARKMMRTSEQKLNSVLHDIKAKFDIATKNKSDFEQKLNSAQGARKLMEQVLKQKILTVQTQCRELRKVCGGFNLAQELHVLVEQLRIEAQMLTSLEAKSQADMVIRELSMFCQNLEGEQQNTAPSKSEMIVVDTGSGSDKTAAKFLSSTRNKVQESNEKVTAVEKLLEAQLKKNKTSVPTTNPTESLIYEPVDEENQEESHIKDIRPVSDSQRKLTSQRSQQSPEILEYLRHTSKKPTTKYEMMTVKELIDEFHIAIAENRSKATIERELRNRAQGVTCPMITASDRAMFARYTNKYSRMNPSDISYQYLRLQRYVNSRLGDDDMNIEKIITIPPELLVELAALYTLFSSEDTVTPDGNNERHQHDDYRRFSPPSSSGTTRPHRSNGAEHGDDRHSQVPMYYSSIPQQPDYYEPAEQNLDNRHTHTELYTEENMHAPPSYDYAVGRRNESLPWPPSRSTSINAQNQAGERQVNNKRSSNRTTAVSYESRPSLDDKDDRYRTNSRHDLATMATDRLVELYSHARKLEDNVQQIAIYTQLEKRCNGEDSELMTNRRMKETLAKYQQLETSTLNDKLDAIKKEIRKLTKGGDATQIKNVPKDLLIKITAITSILRDRAEENNYF